MADDRAYDATLPFDHPHNTAYAEERGWKIDLDWRMYRDKNGLLVDAEGTSPPHPVHALR